MEQGEEAPGSALWSVVGTHLAPPQGGEPLPPLPGSDTQGGRKEGSEGGQRRYVCLIAKRQKSEEKVEKLTTFLRCGPAVAGLRIRVHNFTSSGCVHLF